MYLETSPTLRTQRSIMSWCNLLFGQMHASLRYLTMHHTPLPHLPVRTVFLCGLFRSNHASPLASPPPTGSIPMSSCCSAAPLIQTCQPLEALSQRFMGAAVTASQAETEGAVWCCTKSISLTDICQAQLHNTPLEDNWQHKHSAHMQAHVHCRLAQLVRSQPVPSTNVSNCLVRL